MTNKDILKAAEENSMNYCMQRGIAKGAFIEGALWAMKQCRQILVSAMDLELNDVNDQQ